MTILPNMSIVLPVRGAPGAGTWDDTIDADLGLLDAHDHTTGRGVRIPTAGIGINADLPFSALYAPTQLHRAQFSAIAGAALTNANNLSLFVSDGTGGLAANELYYRNSTGNAIRFTNLNSLNVSAFVGGIGGDYQAVGAQLNYDDAGKRYTFKEGTSNSNGWARLAAGALRLIEFNTSESVYVGQNAPAALAASYDMTWPTALPGSAQAVQVDNTGQISFSNTFAQAMTFSAGATAAAGQHFAVSGAGLYKHGTVTIKVPVNAPRTGNSPGITGDVFTQTGASQSTLFVVPWLPVGSRILACRVRCKDSATGPTVLQASFFSSVDGAESAAIASSSLSAGTGATQTLSMTGMTTIVAALTSYYVRISNISGSATCSYYSVEADYDQP